MRTKSLEPETDAARIELKGIEADNLLGFLTLLGALRALEFAAPDLLPRIAWSPSPWVPALHLAREIERRELAAIIARGCEAIAAEFDVDDKPNVSFDREAFRVYAERVRAHPTNSLLACALAAEAPVRKGKNLRASPLVMMFGSGHQNFLERLVAVPRGELPNHLARKAKPPDYRSPRKIEEALFEPWTRADDADAFRWDPEEDQRYALRFGDPSRAGAAPTVAGANRLAALGFLSFTCIPRADRARTTGTTYDRGAYKFIWPLWRRPLSLSAIEAFLGHPSLLRGSIEELRPLGITEILAATRVENGKYVNVARARPFRASEVAAKR